MINPLAAGISMLLRNTQDGLDWTLRLVMKVSDQQVWHFLLATCTRACICLHLHVSRSAPPEVV